MNSRWWGALLLLVWTSAAADVRVRIETELGAIVVALAEDNAPQTTRNFMRYVNVAAYDGGAFYRVVRPGNQPDSPVKIEVIQGGLGWRAEGLFPPVAHETTEVTGLQHRDGAISMARSTPGSATSEFFICVGDQPELDFGGRRNPDGQGFAAFGRVVEGMDVVRLIQGLDTPEPGSGDDQVVGQMLVEPVPIISIERVP